MKLVEYRKIAKQVSADVEAALAKHGLKMRPFGARIDETLGIVRMTIESVDVNHKAPDGTATTPEREAYKQNHYLYDLKAEWLGQEFTIQGKTYTVEGLNPKKRTKPIVIKRKADSASLICNAETVIRAFAIREIQKAG